MGTNMVRLGWYARRLAAMGPAEIGWRLWREGIGLAGPLLDARTRPILASTSSRARALALFRRGEGSPRLLDPENTQMVLVERPVEAARVVSAAERVLAGHVQYFGYPAVVLERPIDWNRDGVTGHDWPAVPARSLDHRSASADPKWIWELNRLQHLPWLAQAYLFTGREEFAEGAMEHLDSWIEQNPVGQGIAWRGAFEAGIRAISIAVAVQGLKGSPALTPERFERVVSLLRASGRMCWRERSRFSSANNHLIGEMAGLAVIALVLPDLPEARRWRSRALRVLRLEADRQLLPDGAGAEQAVGYQMFTAELLLLVAALCGAREGGDVLVLERAVARSAAYLGAVVGDGDPDPRYGDDDEGFALRLGPEPVRTVAEHLGIVSSFGSSAPVADGGLAAAWIRAATSGRSALVTRARGRASVHAPDGGLVVLRDRTQRLTVDVGPLGYLSLAAHGHADALSVTLSVNGAALIEDPGTGSYYGHPEWRRAHRSTRAHATVTVDDEDQSVMAGPFMWSRRAQVLVHEVDLERGVVDAEHDGYQRLPNPVMHRRRVQVSPGRGGFVVVDVIEGRGHHRVGASWPLAPDLEAHANGLGHVVTRAGVAVLQVATAATVPVEHTHVVGDGESQLGWWSTRLESREPAYLLSSIAEGEVPVVLATVVRTIDSPGALPIEDLRVALDGGQALVSWREHGRSDQSTLTVQFRQPERRY